MRTCVALIALIAVLATGAEAQIQSDAPLIGRIRMATLATSTPDKTVAWYQRWLGYRLVESGRIDRALAASWNAPKTEGRTFTLLAPAGAGDVFVRVAAIDPVPDFKADTTFGWSSLEIIVDNLDKLAAEMKAGGADIVREKAALDPPFASIHAMQVHGTAEEIVNLSSETGDRAKSNLPMPRAQVDRIFLLGMAGPDVDALRSYWVETFRMRPFARYDLPIPIVSKALGLPMETIYPSTLVRAAERGNTVELHAFPPPAKARPRPPGQLPPGVAIASFAVKSLDGLGVRFVAPPAARPGAAYGGKRAATTVGPAGELIELIEE